MSILTRETSLYLNPVGTPCIAYTTVHIMSVEQELVCSTPIYQLTATVYGPIDCRTLNSMIL